MSVFTAFKQFHVLEYLALEGGENSCYESLVVYCRFFETVRHYVVDVLDEDDVGIEVVEVLNECTMASRTEED